MALKGDDKGVVGENVRELKNKGLSERDAVLVSMKNAKKKDKKKDAGCCVPSCGPDEAYPYGLRIELNEDSLDKLGIDKLPGVGDEMEVEAKVEVQSVSENAYQDGENRRSVSLQITKMSLT